MAKKQLKSRKHICRWLSMTLEPSDGRHIIYAPSADPDKPFISIAWWNGEKRCWELIPSVWADAVTHWMNVPAPPTAE